MYLQDNITATIEGFAVEDQICKLMQQQFAFRNVKFLRNKKLFKGNFFIAKCETQPM